MSEIALIGIGPGNTAALTREAAAFCARADLIIGAERMVRAVAADKQETLCAYQPEKIAAAISAHPDAGKIAILMSGDTGFFSGAKKLLPLLPENTKVLPGISSLAAFCARLHTGWDDVRLTSSHGRNSNLIGEIRRHPRVFSILGSCDAVRKTAEALLYFGMSQVQISVGEQLGYPQERITTGTAADFLAFKNHPLSVILLENPDPDLSCTHGLPDEKFLRDKVPMTKEEVREISLCKLRLTRNFVLYDIGAGTGSVSVEAALTDPEGTVWSIEKNPEAVRLLEENRRHFGAANMQIAEGTAPAVLSELPAPTHAFLGGSGGAMREILSALLAKNPEIRVVINAVTLETLAAATEAIRDLAFSDPEIISVNVARSRKTGPYHLMYAQNPVYIISAGGRPDRQA